MGGLPLTPLRVTESPGFASTGSSSPPLWPRLCPLGGGTLPVHPKERLEEKKGRGRLLGTGKVTPEMFVGVKYGEEKGRRRYGVGHGDQGQAE